MALNLGQCREMIDTCEAAGVALFVAYYRRRLPDFLKVRDLLESGAIGEPRFVSIELYHAPKNDLNKDNLPWRVIPEIAGGGHFMDLGSHQLDFLDYVLGPIASVTGRAANQARLYPAEDIVSADFAFESGVLGSGMWCFTVAGQCHADQMQIVGSKGKITFSSFDIAPVRLETAEGVEEFTIPRPEHVQQPLLQTVVDELLGRGKCPSTGVTAARTSGVMDEILKNQP
jgi:predicted dehydrogenase